MPSRVGIPYAICPGECLAGLSPRFHHRYNARALSRVFQPDDVLSYVEMCSAIGVNLQRGMNFRLRNAGSIILMSLRPPGHHTPDQARR